jgi:Protein of unknown function (DUF2752)
VNGELLIAAPSSAANHTLPKMEVDSAMRQQFGNGLEAAAERPSKKLALLAITGLSVLFLLSAILKPSTGEYFTICGFKNFTGLPCPGCGLTHSFCALAKGDFSDAFSFNLLGPALFLILVFAWVRSLSVLLNISNVVQILDRVAERFNLVRMFAIGFGVYGVARIVYLLAFHPLSLHDSPLSQLIARLIH